jgi:hypothetical protein
MGWRVPLWVAMAGPLCRRSRDDGRTSRATLRAWRCSASPPECARGFRPADVAGFPLRSNCAPKGQAEQAFFDKRKTARHKALPYPATSDGKAPGRERPSASLRTSGVSASLRQGPARGGQACPTPEPGSERPGAGSWVAWERGGSAAVRRKASQSAPAAAQSGPLLLVAVGRATRLSSLAFRSSRPPQMGGATRCGCRRSWC